jgi:hypothetical protein
MTDIRPDPVAQALREGAAHIAEQTSTPSWPQVAERHARRSKQRLRRTGFAAGAVLAAAAITVAVPVLLHSNAKRLQTGAHEIRFGHHILIVHDLVAVQKAAQLVPSTRVATRALRLKSPNYASITFGAGSAWVLSPVGNQSGSPCGKLVRINATTLNLTGSVPFRLCPSAVTYGAGSVWVLAFQIGVPGFQIARVNPATLGVTFATTIDRSITPAGDTGAKYMFLTVADSRVFAAVQDRLGGAHITAVNAANGKPAHSITLPPSYGPLTTLAANAKTVWAGTSNGWVLRIDPLTNSIHAAQHLGNRIASLSASRTGIWVAVNLPVPPHATYPGLDILRLSPVTGSLKKDTGIPMTFVAASGDDVWALSSAPPYTSDAGLVAQINPVNGTIIQNTHLTAPTGQAPDTIAVHQGTIWILNDFLGTLTRIGP